MFRYLLNDNIWYLSWTDIWKSDRENYLPGRRASSGWNYMSPAIQISRKNHANIHQIFERIILLKIFFFFQARFTILTEPLSSIENFHKKLNWIVSVSVKHFMTRVVKPPENPVILENLGKSYFLVANSWK